MTEPGPAAPVPLITADPPAAPVVPGVAVRRRRRQVVARAHRVMLRLSDDEYAVVVTAAAVAGVTPSSYAAGQVVAVARGEVAPLPASTGDVVRELVAARTQLVRYATLLNQSVAKLNATGQAGGDLVAAVARCEEVVASLRGATERLGRGVAR